jgi:AAA15 family ATPase/GTPase
MLELYPELRKLYAHWFRQYGLRLVLDTASQSLKVQKEKGEDEVFQLPYSSVADTLQRIIFYKTAVASNKNSVLLFEEPEAHAYPPYISEFTHEVIKAVTNQFFVVTHSPLIVEQFLTDAIDDLGIFMVDFNDGQTVVESLTEDEIKEVYRYGMDLFFNGDSYLV